MRSIRFKHLPTGRTLLVDTQHTRVYGAPEGAETVTRHDQLTHVGELTSEQLVAAARDFDSLWKWPAPGTRFPPRAPEGSSFPEGWFRELAGRLNTQGDEGDLEFGGFLDRVEQRQLAEGGEVRVRRTALERHLLALDFDLKGELGLRDLYRAFIAHRLSPLQSLKKALGAWVIFGRGRPVQIAKIGERRPSSRTGGYDANGNVDPRVLEQYRRLFASTASDELEQARLTSFNRSNFQNGFVSKEQWKSFYATCSDLNGRDTVTYKQLVSLFDGSFGHIAASRADERGRRPLDAALPG